MIYPNIDYRFCFDDCKLHSLVIENQNLFNSFLTDIQNQFQGESGNIVLSKNNMPIDISKNVEMIRDYIGFDINSKLLLGRLYAKAEQLSLEGEQYSETMELLRQI